MNSLVWILNISVCLTPTGWNPSAGVMLFKTGLCSINDGVCKPSCLTQTTKCLHHASPMYNVICCCWDAAGWPWGLQSSKPMVPQTTCFWDSCLLWNIPCWADLFLFFLRLVWCFSVLWWVWWASCNCLLYNLWLQRKLERSDIFWG